MSWLDFFRSTPPGKRLRREDLLGSAEEYPSGSQDTLAAINELSQAVKNNPNAVEIYLALGNLYRSQGEIERAVHIRNNLIVRPGLDPRLKAKAWFELGRDYKRGGMVDRALAAFEEARKLWGNSEILDKELARLAAESGEHEKAARYYEQLRQTVPQAHHLVRLARQSLASGDASAAKKWLNKALKVCPGAVEAWQVRLSNACRSGNWSNFGSLLKEAMTDIEPGLRFLLLESLFEDVRAFSPTPAEPADSTALVPSASPGSSEPPEVVIPLLFKELARHILPVLEQQPAELLLDYYAAWLLIQCGEQDKAKYALEKTLVMQPQFWPARLELLALTMHEQPFAPVFKVQLEFFIGEARRVGRFLCSHCGFKRDRAFFSCPKCRSWYSIAFRTEFHD